MVDRYEELKKEEAENALRNQHNNPLSKKTNQ